MLHPQVLLKFPPEVVVNLSTTAYLPLITRLANETSPKARTAVAATLKLLHKQLQPQQNDQLAGFAQQWLLKDTSSGSQQQLLVLRAAAAHALGLLAEVEGPRFGQRRLSPDFVGQLVSLLAHAAAAAEDAVAARFAGGQQEQQQQEGEDGSAGALAALSGGVPRWQEVYHILLMLEKASTGPGAAQPLAWHQGLQVQQLWQVIVQQLLLHPHLWVRRVAGRLLGLGLAAPAVYSGLIRGAAAAAAAGNGNSCSVSAGSLALTVYMQLEADVVDEGLCTQAVKCLVALAKYLAAAQQGLGEQQQQQQQEEAGRGAAAAETDDDAAAPGSEDEQEAEEGQEGGNIMSSSEREDEEQPAAANGAANGHPQQQQQQEEGLDEQLQQQEDQQQPEVTLQGLIVRMVKLAEDARFARQLQRLAALRWIAAAAAAVGTAPLLQHLPLLVRPLYRIAETAGLEKIQQQSHAAGASSNSTPEEVRVLSEQVLAHLRTLFGSEQMLVAYTAAREAVRAARAARKTAAARRVLLDPEAASREKLKRGRKKSQARQRKAEERRRQRGSRGSGGFGYKASQGVGKGKKLNRASR